MLNWTFPERITLLTMWGAKASASQIAAALGTSRSAVIGKLNRIGFGGDDDSRERAKMTADAMISSQQDVMPIPAKGKVPEKPPKPLMAEEVAEAQARMDAFFERARARKRAGRDFKPSMEQLLALAASDEANGGISIMDLRNHTCRWPKGDPRKEEVRYCGEPGADLSLERPYCPLHHLKAYRPVEAALLRKARHEADKDEKLRLGQEARS